MRAVLIQEGVCAPGEEWAQRIRDSLVEAVLADQVGFDVYAMSEQHFASGQAITSAPEILMPAVAVLTKNIQMRIASVNLLPYNHPIRISEQLATLEIISNGRAQLGGARSNNPYTLDAFGVDAKTTRDHRNEQLQVICQAMSDGVVKHEGTYYSIPKRKISPRQPGGRIPPIHLSASGIDSHRDAGAAGYGAMTGLSIVGWEYAEACLTAYKEAAANPKPIMGVATNCAGLFSAGVCCHKDRQTARNISRPVSLQFVGVILDFFLKLAPRSPDYRYFTRLNEIVDRKDDLDYLVDSTPYIMAGTPDDLIEKAKALYDMGYDEVLWRVDGMGHENNIASIEMIGKHVLPELHSWPDRGSPQV